MVVDYTVRDGTFMPGRPRQWVGTPLANTGVLANFDVSADGRRVIALMPAAPPDQEQSRNHATVILSFDAEVARRLRAQAGQAGSS